MKRLILVPLLLLAACEKPVEEAPPPEPTSAAAAPVQDTWPGKYSGDLIVRVAGNPTAGHKVTLIEASPDGCAGDLGVIDGGLVTNKLSTNELQLILHPDPTSTCTINIVKSDDTLTITEKGACGAYHGATCSFSGTVTRVAP